MRKLATFLSRYLPFVAFVCATAYAIDLGGGAALAAFDVHGPTCAASLALLALALAARALIWHLLAQALGTRLPLGVSLQSQLQPVLAKYIPGKIWLYLNTAAILHGHGVTYQRSAALTVVFQLLIVAGAVALAGYGLFGATLAGTVSWTLAWVALTAAGARLAGSLGASAQLRELAARWRLQAWGLPPLGVGRALVLVGLSALDWLFIAAGFLLFFHAMGLAPGAQVLFLQPLANVAGALAVFAPGGLGIREFATAGYLELLGIGFDTALAVALVSRLWFLAAEVVLYMAGLGLQLRQRSKARAGVV